MTSFCSDGHCALDGDSSVRTEDDMKQVAAAAYGRQSSHYFASSKLDGNSLLIHTART